MFAHRRRAPTVAHPPTAKPAAQSHMRCFCKAQLSPSAASLHYKYVTGKKKVSRMDQFIDCCLQSNANTATVTLTWRAACTRSRSRDGWHSKSASLQE